MTTQHPEVDADHIDDKPRSRTVRGSRLLQDRFSAEELQAMIDLYCSGTSARMVAERYGGRPTLGQAAPACPWCTARPPDIAS